MAKSGGTLCSHLDRLLALAEELRTALTDLSSHAGFQSTKLQTQDGVRIELMSGGPYWRRLSTAGLAAQYAAMSSFQRFDELARFALAASPIALLEDYNSNRHALHGLVHQRDPSYKEVGDRMLGFAPALEAQIKTLRHAAFRPPEALIVPDTNVMLSVPNLHRLAESDQAVTIVLVPTVVQELDRLKVSGRDNVRANANAAVRRLKEMRRRGNLLSGVRVEKQTHLRAVATEPKPLEIVAWLDPTHMDDRLIASTMDVARRNLSGTTVLITGDVNLQNKAAFAEVAFREPPTLAEESL